VLLSVEAFASAAIPLHQQPAVLTHPTTPVVPQVPDAAAWSTALQQADIVFHVLHGHEQHTKEALLALLQRTVSRITPR
jgi:hypothetical protein